MSRTLSPLRYPGGKSQIAKYFEDIIMLNSLQRGTYIEPFAGGAGIAWYLLDKGIVENIIINDLSPSIFSFWDAVLTKTEQLCSTIEKTDITINEWQKQRLIQKKQVISFELGFSTFFLNRVNRSGILNAGVIGGKNQKGTYKLDCRFNKEALIRKIQKIASKSEFITNYNLDANQFLTNISPTLEEKSLINIDPPYYNKGKALYQNYFQHEDHITLFETIKALQHPWVVTYDDTPEIFDIYKDFYPQKFLLNYSVQRKRKGSELIMFSQNLSSANIFQELSA